MESARSLLISGRRASEVLLVMPLIDHLINEGWRVEVALYEFFDATQFLQKHSQVKYHFKVHPILPMTQIVLFLKSLLSCLVYLNDNTLDQEYKRRQLKRSLVVIGDFGSKLIRFISKIPEPIWNFLSGFAISILRSLIYFFVRKRKYIVATDLKFDALLVVGGFISSSGEDLVIVQAREQSIPSFVYFRSHDTLNSKGSIAILPSVFFVQNQWQKNLLNDRHKCDSMTFITGSIFFNYLETLGLQSSKPLSRKESLPSNKRELLFLSSSRSNFEGEIDFFRKLCSEASLYVQKTVNIWVRPHPSVVDLWKKEISSEQIQFDSRDLWERAKQSSKPSSINFDAFFCINTSGLMDMMVLNPDSIFFVLLNPSARFQANTSQYRNFIESGTLEFDSITSALKSVFEIHPSFNWELHNKRVMQAILPNNAKAIRTIQKHIESIILENQVS